MQQTTAFMKSPVTSESLYDFIAVEKQITEALVHLGYDLKRCEIFIDPVSYRRYRVDMNGTYFGVWDVYRQTFVD